MGELVNL